MEPFVCGTFWLHKWKGAMCQCQCRVPTHLKWWILSASSPATLLFAKMTFWLIPPFAMGRRHWRVCRLPPQVFQEVSSSSPPLRLLLQKCQTYFVELTSYFALVPKSLCPPKFGQENGGGSLRPAEGTGIGFILLKYLCSKAHELSHTEKKTIPPFLWFHVKWPTERRVQTQK
jgi:hypothetical protein